VTAISRESERHIGLEQVFLASLLRNWPSHSPLSAIPVKSPHLPPDPQLYCVDL
jgi:hypothetical protein